MQISAGPSLQPMFGRRAGKGRLLSAFPLCPAPSNRVTALLGSEQAVWPRHPRAMRDYRPQKGSITFACLVELYQVSSSMPR